MRFGKFISVITLLLCGVVFIVTASPLMAASVTVSPNAVVKGGVVVRVNWSGFSGNVNVAVYKGSGFWVHAVTNAAGTGYQDLDTTGWELRSDYRVKIELRSNTSIYQYSSYFSVSDPKLWLSTTSVVQGETVRANWSGFSGNVNVAVYKGSGFWVHSVINVAGTGYQDLDTTGWELRSDYRVKVELRENTDVYEYSDYFAVSIPVPTGVTAAYQSSHDWNYITWNAVSGATGYKVYWGTSPGVTMSSNVMPETSSTEYGHTNVEVGYCYYYRVAAVNSGGESALSSEVSACVPPATPTGLSLTQITGGFRISWNNVSGTSGTNPYKIYWGTNDSVDETNYSGIIEDNGTPSDHINLESGTTYYYRIKACNSSGCSALSGIVSALYQPSPPAPPTLISPANGAILPVGEDITFEWSNSSGAVRSRVKICTDLEMNNPISSAPFETGPTSTIVSSSFFVAGVTYHWQAISIGSDESAGWGIYGPTPPWSFTVTLPVADSPVFVPLYRLYKNSIHDHYYTTIPAHRDDYVQNKGYTYEKIECYISDRPFDHPDCGALFHLWDINNDIHFYTSDESEKAIKMGQGFSDQGPVGYIYTAPADGMVPFYYVEHQTNTDHFYTISKFEFDNATDNYGFVDKGVVGYVSPWDLKDRDAHTRPQANYGGVDLGSGAYRGLNNRDLVLRGRGPSLAFSHYYNSFNFSRYPMGQGWSHGLYSHIFEEIEDDKVYVFWGNGTVSEFTKTGSNPSDYHDETGDHDALAIVDDGVNYGYDLKKKDQTVYKFRVIGGDYLRDIVLISIEDWAGKQLVFDYEADHVTLLSVRDELGRKLQLSYYYPSRQLQKVEEVIDGVAKRFVLFTYNDKELLDSFTDSGGKVTSYAYYEEDGSRKNLLESITYPEHNTVKLDYDDDKRVNWIKIGNDLPSTITYPSPNTAVVRDPRGHTFTSIHNGFRLTGLQGQIDPNPETFVYGNTLNPNKPTHFADKEGNATDFEYDSMGNVTKITNARSKVALFTYNTDMGKNNIKSSTEFHTEGTAITPTMYNYDTGGNRLRSVTNPENETMWLYYDASHQVTSVKDGRNKDTYFAYDAYGNLERVTDAENNVTHHVNDYAGRTIQEIDAEYKNTWYVHDDTNNLTLVKNHLNHEVAMSYNDNSFLDAVTWLNNGVTSSTNYDYDPENRLKFVTNPLSRVASFTYNESGNLETRNDYNDVTTTYQYDENGRLKTINHPGDVDDISIGRDNNGSIISATGQEGESKFEYNELNLLKKYTDPYGNIVQYEYNDADRLKTLTCPGGKTVTYGYDKAGRLQSVQDWITGSNPTTYEYDDAGNLTRIVRPNNTEAIYSYDDASRLTGITEQKIGDAIICSYAYVLDGVGNHKSVTATEPLTGSVLPKDVSYTHDKANRLLSAGSATYTYDNKGNRMTSTDAGGTTYTWNNENMLTGIVENSPSRSVQYKYNGMNNRIAKIEGSNTTKYVLDLRGDMSRVLAETDENGTIQAYYVYGLGLISRITPDESRHFYHYNNRGNTIALTDASGDVTDSYTYDEYGKLLESTGSTENPFKFVGRYGVMDEGNDLYFMRARFYDAEVGRFLNEDPLGFGGGDWNLHAYVGGNPVIGIDPEGLAWQTTIIKFGYKPAKKFIESDWFADKSGDILYNFLFSDGLYTQEIDNDLAKLQQKFQLISDVCDTTFDIIGTISDMRELRNLAMKINKLGNKIFDLPIQKQLYSMGMFGIKATSLHVNSIMRAKKNYETWKKY